MRTLAEVALVVSNHGRFPMSTATLAPLMPLTAEMATFTITSNRSDAIFVKSLLMLCALSVSYTHLDVYKRQSSDKERKPSTARGQNWLPLFLWISRRASMIEDASW